MVMFGAQDPAEVDYYLDVQRERVRFMAFQYAEPMVTFLGNSRMSRGQIYLPLLTKWRGILRELRENETKKVGSSVTTLEMFFRAEMDDIHLDTFLEKIPPEALTARSGDYFLFRA